MENLAAHVTPALVNVTVDSRDRRRVCPTSRAGRRGQGQGEDQDDQGQGQGQDPFQRFLGPSVLDPRCAVDHRLNTVWAAALSLSPDGYIVTNNHVIDGAVDIGVTMNEPSRASSQADRHRPADRPCGSSNQSLPICPAFPGVIRLR